MKRIINLGKIDWNGTGRKRNMVTLEVELKDTKYGPEFTVCGNVWNTIKTDVVCAGQCLDELVPFFENNANFIEIYKFWKAYHLNGLHAGTPKQEAYLKTIMPTTMGYDDRVQALTSAGLLWDYDADLKYCNGGIFWDVEKQEYYYKYGHGWVYFPIPALDLERIKMIIEEE